MLEPWAATASSDPSLVFTAEPYGYQEGADGWSVTFTHAGREVGSATLCRRCSADRLALYSLSVDGRAQRQGVSSAFLQALREFVLEDGRFSVVIFEQVTSRRMLALVEREFGPLEMVEQGAPLEDLPEALPAEGRQIACGAPGAHLEVKVDDLRARFRSPLVP